MILRRPPSLQLYASFHPPLQSIALRATRVLLRTGDFGGPSLHHLFFQKLLWMLFSSSQSRKDLRGTKTRKPICFWPSSSRRQQRTPQFPIYQLSSRFLFSLKIEQHMCPFPPPIHPPKCIHKGTPNNSVVLSRYSYVHNGPSPPPSPPFANVSEPSSPPVQCDKQQALLRRSAKPYFRVFLHDSRFPRNPGGRLGE